MSEDIQTPKINTSFNINITSEISDVGNDKAFLKLNSHTDRVFLPLIESWWFPRFLAS